MAELWEPEAPADTHPDLRVDQRRPFSPTKGLEAEHQKTANVLGRAVRSAMRQAAKEISKAETAQERRKIVRRIQKQVLADIPTAAINKRSRRAAGIADKANQRQWGTAIRKAPVSGEQKREMLEEIRESTTGIQREWSREQIRKFRRDIRKQFAVLNAQITRLGDGAKPETVLKHVRNRSDVSLKNIRRGALQDVQRLNTQLTRARAKATGSKRFRWRSRRVHDVRPLHTRLDKISHGKRAKTWPVATGHPDEGFPGITPFGCLCSMEIVIRRRRKKKKDTVCYTPARKRRDSSRFPRRVSTLSRPESGQPTGEASHIHSTDCRHQGIDTEG